MLIKLSLLFKIIVVKEWYTLKERKLINIQIGERIKQSREKAGYTQERFAEAIGVTVQYISDLERGIVGTSISTMIKICETLCVSSDYILMGLKEKNDLSDITERLQYLNAQQLDLVNRGINLILESINSSNYK